jgi:hypothetical protein
MFWEGINDTLVRYVKKDFKISIPKHSKFADIKKHVIKELRKLSRKELIDKRSELNLDIANLELHNFDNFVSVRFAYYALVLAIVVMIKEINLENYIGYIFGVLTLMLVSFRHTSDVRKDRMLYYKFKLDCVTEILG